jgi:hypothetical protein
MTKNLKKDSKEQINQTKTDSQPEQEKDNENLICHQCFEPVGPHPRFETIITHQTKDDPFFQDMLAIGAFDNNDNISKMIRERTKKGEVITSIHYFCSRQHKDEYDKQHNILKK